MTELVREEVAKVVGEEGVRQAPLKMGAEDFSYFLEEVPGAFWFVGSQNPERGLVWGHHHPGSTWMRRRWRSVWNRWPMSRCATSTKVGKSGSR